MNRLNQHREFGCALVGAALQTLLGVLFLQDMSGIAHSEAVEEQRATYTRAYEEAAMALHIERDAYTLLHRFEDGTVGQVIRRSKS